MAKIGKFIFHSLQNIAQLFGSKIQFRHFGGDGGVGNVHVTAYNYFDVLTSLLITCFTFMKLHVNT